MKDKKGSALIVTLIILGIVLTIALSLALVSARERRAAISASKTGISYQTADEGIEKVMYDILKMGYTNINQIMPGNCNGSLIISTGYKVELLDENEQHINCNSPESLSLVKNLKSVGTSEGSQKTERSVKMSVPKAYCNGVSDDSDTKLLLHMDGGATGNEFIDSSPEEHDVTPSGGANISSTETEYKFCKGGSFDGSGDYLLVNSSDFQLSGQFTIDFWVKPLDVAKHQVLFEVSDFSFKFKDGKLNLRYGSSDHDLGGSISNGNWYHIAVSRDSSSNVRVFLNGSQVSSFALSTTVGTGNQIYIAAGSYLPATYGFRGYMDEFRLFKGDTEWTDDFSDELPEEPY